MTSAIPPGIAIRFCLPGGSGEVFARDWNTRTFNIWRQTEVGRLDKAKSLHRADEETAWFCGSAAETKQSSPLLVGQTRPKL